MSAPEDDLHAAITRLAASPQLLVVCDFDGVLAPIVSHPDDAAALPASVAALELLTTAPRTRVAVVSGRSLQNLAEISKLPDAVRLIGSHGREMGESSSPTSGMPPALLTQLNETLTTIADGRPGVILERKPLSIAVHTRNADRAVAAAVQESVQSGPASWPGVHTMVGKEVVELSVADGDKGKAVTRLREDADVFFMGDDVTDEDAFAILRDADVGVKVGDGQTRARWRVADPQAAAQALELLARERHRLSR